jgi:hypothetical protein
MSEKVNSNRIDRITIVGGGTAGWLTALIVNGRLNKNPREQSVKVTVIESPTIPTIGVGESTIQNLKVTLQDLGIDEAEFIRRSNGSFKLGVRYSDWSVASNTSAPQFFHPLNNPPPCDGLSPVYHFRKFGPHWFGTSFGENILPNAAVVAAGKGPRAFSGGNYQWDINYAYHVDAALLAEFMRDFAVSRGVTHVRDDVIDVVLDEAGAVAALQLERGGRYPIEFVVDCTGFKSLIWGRMGAEPFVSAGDRLLNDRAIPLQVEHPNPTNIEPCTRAVALGAGWAWRVPLYSRVGTGYVYSSAFRTDDEARAEFLAHLLASGDLPAGGPEPDTRVIKMRVGYTRQPWIKNCVAIGLSSGFVEPLEATAIYSIDAAATRLVMNFPDKQCSPALAKAFNQRSTTLIEEIIDFLQVNYLTSNRAEPYWAAFRQETQRSDWLREKMELWQYRYPDYDDTYGKALFDFSNYIYALYPKGYFSKIHPALENTIRLEDWKKFGQELTKNVNKLVATLPSHYDLLTHIRSAGSLKSTNLRSSLGSPALAGAQVGRR